ncbi:MAG TPA: hypothetical protein VGC91_05890 [Pyrinomonadaceae bacterium]|jgi:hypothetical protein
MRKIIPYLIKLSVLLMAFSLIGQQVSATKGDVERALELLKQARAAIGGEAAINSVQSLSLNGQSRRQLQLPDQTAKELNGQFELHMLLPDKMMRLEKLSIGTPDGAERPQVSEDKEVKIVRDSQFKIMRADDAEKGEVENAMRQHEQAELAHYMLGLLLTPPPSFNVTYNYAGEGDVEGARAEIIEAQGAGGFAMKIYLDKSSHLPLMMSYQGSFPRIPLGQGLKISGAGDEGEDIMILRHRKDGDDGQAQPRIIVRDKDGERVVQEGDKFTLPAPAPEFENASIQIRFSDFRPEGGVMLPHTLTQLVNGKVDTVWTVDGYEINSPSINDKFQKNFKFKMERN